MSLDVYLLSPEPVETRCACCGALTSEQETLYEQNITHNLNTMAEAAGIYKHLWRPEEINITRAGQLIEPLTEGLRLLRADPAKYRELNPANGWGSYEGLVKFVESYLIACKDYPEAEIKISR